MKILIIGPYPPPYGGQSVHVKELCNFLKRQLKDARVLNIGEGRKILNSDCININNVFDFSLKLIYFLFNGFSVHIHTHGHSSASWRQIFFSGCITRIFGKKFYVTLHSGMCPAYVKNSSGINKFFIKLTIRLSTHIVAVNKDIFDSLNTLYNIKDKAKIIEAFSITTEENRVKIDNQLEELIKTHKPLISCIGFPRPEYGLYLIPGLVENLVKIFPNVGILVIGANCPNDSEAPIENKSIHWLGPQDRTTSLYLISQSDLFVRPTLEDGDAISVREALAFNIPVVASKVGYRPEGVVQFEAGNLKEFSLAVEKVLQSPNMDSGPNKRRYDRSLYEIMNCYEEFTC